MKTTFELEFPDSQVRVHGIKGEASIIGESPNHKPYVSISITTNKPCNPSAFIKDKDLERFAVNILKALKSKKLKS